MGSPVIRRLSDVTVNRIAAGEVIERPAAVVKELVENAIDAGATRISVSLDRGGIDRVEVTDNGCGMSVEDMPLAIDRHCTSKLDDDQLVRIATLGFRGEALPSIGAAARLSITSRLHDAADGAWNIRVEGGSVSGPEPCAGLPGTRVVVEDIFFSTPARRKFLKSPRVEAGHAESVVRRLALSAPGVAFSLEVDGRNLFDLPAQTVLQRVEAILDVHDADGLLPVLGQRGEASLTGHICGPAIHRATANSQIIIVNGRPVIDPVIRTAVRVAYRHVIEHGRHPVVALFLSVPAEHVDVNVHPAKMELRFAEPDTIKSLVIGSVQRALASGAGSGGGLRAQALLPRSTRAHAGYPPAHSYDTRRLSAPIEALSPYAVAAEPHLTFDDTPAARFIGGPGGGSGDSGNHCASAEALPAEKYPLGAAVAQVLGTYIIAVCDDNSLVLVDQHAAHERLTHEEIRAQYLNGQVTAQRLLLPEVVSLPPMLAERILAFSSELSAFALEVEPFGDGTLLVRTIPALLGKVDCAALLRDIADELAGNDLLTPGETQSLSGCLDAVVARMACHGSIRAGRRMTGDEMNTLLRQMEQNPMSNTCSHGRPTWVRLERKDIERLFGRR